MKLEKVVFFVVDKIGSFDYIFFLYGIKELIFQRKSSKFCYFLGLGKGLLWLEQGNRK